MVRNNITTNRAGLHLAAGEASLRGMKVDVERDGRRRFLRINDKVVQVKARRNGDWQLDGPDEELHGDVEVMILVDLVPCLLEPQQYPVFYIMRQEWLRDKVKTDHDQWLASQPGGRRPRNPDSKHHRITVQDVESKLGLWELLDKQ